MTIITGVTLLAAEFAEERYAARAVVDLMEEFLIKPTHPTSISMKYNQLNYHSELCYDLTACHVHVPKRYEDLYDDERGFKLRHHLLAISLEVPGFKTQHNTTR